MFMHRCMVHGHVHVNVHVHVHVHVLALHFHKMPPTACCSGKRAFSAIDQKTEVVSSDDEEADDVVVKATKRRIINSGQSRYTYSVHVASRHGVKHVHFSSGQEEPSSCINN